MKVLSLGLFLFSFLSPAAFAAISINGDSLGCANGKPSMIATVTIDGVAHQITVDCAGGTVPVETNGASCMLWSIGCETGGPGQIGVSCENGEQSSFPLACQ